jgi:hypothetical protein
MNKKQLTSILAAAAMVLAGCATAVKTEPVNFVPSPGAEIIVTRAVDIQLPTQYTRTLPKDSRWRKVGTVPQGDAYRPIGMVFTIEGRNTHEAYLVLTNTHALVGFYLPGESNLSMLPAPIQLPTKENP